MDPAERDTLIRYYSEPDAAGRGPTLRGLAARMVDAEELAKKLELQLDGWATLLGITAEYWLPADSTEKHRDDMRRFFFALSYYGRKNALKSSHFNTEAIAYRQAVERESDKHRAEKHDLMRKLEDNQTAVELIRAVLDKREEQLRQAKAALQRAEDFVVTHAVQGDEELLGVIGKALDNDII